MENQQQSMQPQQSFNVSPAVVMFAVLAALLALVGLYVTNRDIETRGVTVLESTVPLQFENGATGLAGRYPDGWRYVEQNDLLIFTPLDARSDDPTAITLLHTDQSLTPEEVIAQIVQSAESIVDEADSYDDLPDGETVTVRESDDIEVRYIVFSDEQGGFFLAAVRSEDASDYARELEAMAATVGFIEPFALTQIIEETGFTLPYPEGFTATVLQNNFVVVEQDGVAGPDQIIFQIVLGLPDRVLGTTLESYSSETIVQFYVEELTGITAEGEIVPVQFGGFSGSRIPLVDNANPDVITNITVLDVGLPEFLFLFVRTPRDGHPKVVTTVNAMLEELVITAVASEPISPDLVFEGEALPLTQVAERPTFAISYPEGWVDSNNEGGNVIAVFEDTTDSNALQIRLFVDAVATLFDTPDISTADAIGLLAGTLTDYTAQGEPEAVTLGGYEAYQLLLTQDAEPPLAVLVVVLDLRDGNFLIITSRSIPAEYGVARATVAAMVDTLVYDTVSEVAPVEETDAATPSEETEVAEPETTEAAEPTDASVEPAATQNAVDEVNDIRGE